MSEIIEQAAIGMMLRESDNYIKAVSLGVTEEHFMFPSKKEIFSLINEQSLLGKAIGPYDIHEIASDDLKLEIINCVEKSPLTENISFWCQELINGAWRRMAGLKLNELSRKILTNAPFNPIDKLVAEISDTAFELINFEKMCQTKSIKDICVEIIPVIEKRMLDYKGQKAIGISTGLKKLDDNIQGFVKGRFYILAARTGVGKTSLATFFAHKAMLQKKSVAYFTVEMTDLEIIEKHISISSRVNGGKLFNGNLSDEDLDSIVFSIRELSQMDGFVNSKFGRSLQAIETESKILKRQNKLDFLIIDYIGQVEITGKKFTTRQAELSEITARLQSLALSLNIPILAVSQINREAEKFDEPQNHHLKDSGSIEQDASVIILLHRKEQRAGEPMLLIVSKNRYGNKGKFYIDCDFANNVFSDSGKLV